MQTDPIVDLESGLLSGSGDNLVLIAGAVAGSLLFAIIVTSVLLLRRKKKMRNDDQEQIRRKLEDDSHHLLLRQDEFANSFSSEYPYSSVLTMIFVFR